MPTEQINIRNATPADAAVLDSLIRQLAAHEGAAHLISFTQGQVAAALGNERLRAILAEDGEGVCGFVTFTVDFAIWNGGDILRVDDVFVSDRVRRRGIGRQLMLRIAKLALEGNMIARWEIEPVNLAAQQFYLGLGANLRDKIVARWELPAMAGAVGSSA
ncbi:N-acetyltransferase family protein [Dongia sp.]|uniref:GNAT family N-acetyltransferase n=1 Tax=Dongia sp. TaxID=1977262 RepID=UPI0035AEEA81